MQRNQETPVIGCGEYGLHLGTSIDGEQVTLSAAETGRHIIIGYEGPAGTLAWENHLVEAHTRQGGGWIVFDLWPTAERKAMLDAFARSSGRRAGLVAFDSVRTPHRIFTDALRADRCLYIPTPIVGSDNVVAHVEGLLSTLTFAIFDRARDGAATAAGTPFLVVLSDWAQRLRLAPALHAQATKAGICLVSSGYEKRGGPTTEVVGGTLLRSASSENFAMGILLNLLHAAPNATMVVRAGKKQIIHLPGNSPPQPARRLSEDAGASHATVDGFTGEPVHVRIGR